MSQTRRQFLATGAAAIAATALPRAAGAAPFDFVLEAKERPILLPGCGGPTQAWTYAETWPLALRVKRRQPVTIEFRNGLAEHSSIHWHGLRIPHAMDGVPWITQDPVRPGDRFTYSFAPPDPGLFFFHPHCDDITALSHGLAGVIIVEDPRESGLFDQEELLVLMDWRVKDDGSYDTITTDKTAARAGTFGRLRTTNGQLAPAYQVRPGARLRLRCINVDASRIPLLDIVGAGAQVIATDGNACAPFPLSAWPLGPAMRADLALIAPDEAGAVIELHDVWQSTPVVLARFEVAGEPLPVAGRDRPLALPPAELPEPDLANAVKLELDLGAGVTDPAVAEFQKLFGADEICTTRRVFWSLNTRAWPGMAATGKPEPLAVMKSGASYVVEIFNGTPHRHPMHLHGHTFKVIGSSKRDVPVHWADTVLLEPKERLKIAFVGGEPGDWMVHCHIIEHQETGMMGYYRVA